MNTLQRELSRNESDKQNFDELMADLFVLVTHHSLTQCETSLPEIVNRIQLLTQHDDIEYYPKQLKVLLKMRTLWRTKLFRKEVQKFKH